MIERIVVTGKALERLQEAMDDVDYCFLCDNHVSSGHSNDCPLVVNSDDLLEALKAITSENPIIETHYADLFCFYCGADAEISNQHSADCAWMKAKAVIAKATGVNE